MDHFVEKGCHVLTGFGLTQKVDTLLSQTVGGINTVPARPCETCRFENALVFEDFDKVLRGIVSVHKDFISVKRVVEVDGQNGIEATVRLKSEDNQAVVVDVLVGLSVTGNRVTEVVSECKRHKAFLSA